MSNGCISQNQQYVLIQTQNQYYLVPKLVYIVSKLAYLVPKLAYLVPKLAYLVPKLAYLVAKLTTETCSCFLQSQPYSVHHDLQWDEIQRRSKILTNDLALKKHTHTRTLKLKTSITCMMKNAGKLTTKLAQVFFYFLCYFLSKKLTNVVPYKN